MAKTDSGDEAVRGSQDPADRLSIIRSIHPGRSPDFPPGQIVIQFFLDADPEVVEDAGLAPWLLAETLRRAAEIADWQYIEEGEEEEDEPE